MSVRDMPTWGLVSTIKARDDTILDFAAYHLDLGAHRLHIYLDEDAPRARQALENHPKCRVTLCDDAYWQKHGPRDGRPPKHQTRQSHNATRAYRRNPQVDWLAHIDVDEFLLPETDLPAQLAALPTDTVCARTRAVEALAEPDGRAPRCFKACHLNRKERMAATRDLYPEFGIHLNGGFLSHVAGKIFTRTGLPGLRLRIHQAFLDGAPVKDDVDLPQTRLLHLHAPSWDDFLAAYHFRLSHGSYRAELKGAPTPEGEGLTMNALFQMIEADGGEAALRRFYDEVCTASPRLLKGLEERGLLICHALDFGPARARHFPQR